MAAAALETEAPLLVMSGEEALLLLLPEMGIIITGLLLPDTLPSPRLLLPFARPPPCVCRGNGVMSGPSLRLLKSPPPGDPTP